MTKREKQDAAKGVIKELLEKKTYKSNELIDAAAELFTARFGDDSDNPNDVKGRIGSILDTMKKETEVQFDGGVYALKVEEKAKEVEKPAKAKRTEKTEKAEEKTEEKTAKKPAAKKTKAAEKTEEDKEEKPKKRTATKKSAVKETAEKKEEKPAETEEVLPLPPAPLQPIAPVVPVTPEVAPEPTPETPAPKKRGRKAKTATETTVAVKEEKPVETKEETAKIESVKTEEKTEEKKEEVKPTEVKAAETVAQPKSEPVKAEETQEAPVVKTKTAEAPKGTVMDMSFLFGEVKKQEPRAPRAESKPMEAKTEAKAEVKVHPKATETPVEKKEIKVVEQTAAKPQSEARKEARPAPVSATKPVRENKEPTKKNEAQNRGKTARVNNNAVRSRVLTADEKLQEAFLSRLHRLGGEYFEYYSVYLLEKYSRRNGRRLEGLKVNGGDHDGGIDGEIELTDRLGFRETIYIQAKNWDPDKGDEKLWVVGETLLQQFIGACVCRQAKQGKQNCRGIFITTSRFTPEAKRILSEAGDRFVGYDGTDLYETAKECGFGIVKKNGEWALDEELLAGEKAFFNLL